MRVLNPVFIIGSYRGGTSLLFRLLSESKSLWSMYREANHIWQSYYRHENERSDSVFLEEQEDGSFINLNTKEKISNLLEKREELDLAYHYCSYDNYALGFLSRVKFLREKLPFVLDIINFFNYFYKAFKLSKYRIVDKTPPNIFRIDYLSKLYPGAKFVYITRNPVDNVNSLINAWCHKKKFKYPYRDYLTHDLEIKDCDSHVWKFFIPKNFLQENYQGKSIASIAMGQYQEAHEAALESFSKMDKEKFLQVKFEDLLSEPSQVMQKICNFVDVDFDEKMQKIIEAMPAVNTDSKDPKKKPSKLHDFAEIQSLIETMQNKLGYNQSSYV